MSLSGRWLEAQLVQPSELSYRLIEILMMHHSVVSEYPI